MRKVGEFALLGLGACHAAATPLPAAVEAPPRAGIAAQAPSPQAESATKPPPPPSLSDLTRRTSEAYSAAYKVHDKDKLAALFTDDACIKIAGHGDACGRAAIAHAAKALWTAFPDARTAWSRSRVAGDVLVVESAWTGTNDGESGGRKPTHKTAGAAALTLSWFAPDGRIREEHVYSDAGFIATQLGAAGPGRAFEGLPTSRERHVSTGTPRESADVELARGATASIFTDDAELVDFSLSGSMPKKKGAAQWLAVRKTGLSETRVEITHAWGIDGSVVCELAITGHKIGAPHGETVTVHAVEVLELEDGKVLRAARYKDSLELTPLAWLPPPLASLGQ